MSKMICSVRRAHENQICDLCWDYVLSVPILYYKVKQKN